MALEFVDLGAGDYDRAKSVLNKANHPGFVGRELFYRCATTGKACVAVLDGKDVGVALIVKERLQALSVAVAAQGSGVGQALMRRLQPRWVNAIEERVGFFERLGYKRFGSPKIGQNGKHATQLMERGEMPSGDAPNIDPVERKRAPNIDPVERKARTFVIAQLMAANAYGRKQEREFAAAWNCKRNTVRRIAIEASRLLEWTTSDRETLRKVVEVRLMQIANENDGDRVQALRTILEATGLLRQQHEIELRSKAAPVAELYASALAHPGFREFLIEQGWTPPVAPVLTEGTAVE